MKKKNYKTQFKLTAPMKTWRSILLSMELYPTHCIHIDTNLSRGLTCRWATTGDEAGTHVEQWDMKTSGRLKSFKDGIFVLQYGDKEGADNHPVLAWKNVTHVHMPDAREWIEDHLAMNRAPTIYWDYNQEGWLTSVAKPFSMSR